MCDWSQGLYHVRRCCLHDRCKRTATRDCRLKRTKSQVYWIAHRFKGPFFGENSSEWSIRRHLNPSPANKFALYLRRKRRWQRWNVHFRVDQQGPILMRTIDCHAWEIVGLSQMAMLGLCRLARSVHARTVFVSPKPQKTAHNLRRSHLPQMQHSWDKKLC